VDPRVTVDAAVRSVADAETAATIEIDADVDVVAADRERLQQVLTNLVENALKYGRTPTSPTIGVRVRNVRDSVRFEVSDQGPGVPAAESERIFEKFHRLDPHMQRGVRGTGLGLYICRELVHRMHGSIGVDSSEAGSTFWVELPRY
jgi:signal transduction histidine kinase